MKHWPKSALVLLLSSSSVSLAWAQPAPPSQSETPPEASGEAAAPSSPAAVAPIVTPKPTLALEEEMRAFIVPGELTAEHVAARAEKSSSRISAKRAAYESAEATHSQTGERFYPQLNLSARYTRLSEITQPSFGGGDGTSQVFLQETNDTPRPVTGADQLIAVSPPALSFPVILDNFELRATLNVPISDYLFRMSDSLSATSKAKEAAEWTEKAERLIIKTEARVAYYSWVKALGAEYIAKKGVEQLELAKKDVDRAFALGTASKADVLRTEAQLKSLELARKRASRGVALAEENLRTMMHDAPRAHYAVGEDVSGDVVLAVPTLESGVAEARSKRLELKALTSIEDSFVKQAGISRADLYPRLDAQGNLIYANPNQRIIPATGDWNETWDVSLVLSWTPTAIPQALSGASAMKAKAAEYRAQRLAMEDGLRMEIAQAITEFENAQGAVETSREVLKSAEEGYRVRRELFAVGRATTLEVNDAQTSLTQARLDLLFSRIDARIARAKLLHALGRDADTGAS